MDIWVNVSDAYDYQKQLRLFFGIDLREGSVLNGQLFENVHPGIQIEDLEKDAAQKDPRRTLIH